MNAKFDLQKISKTSSAGIPASSAIEYTFTPNTDSKSDLKEFQQKVKMVLNEITKLHDVAGKKVEYKLFYDPEGSESVSKFVLHLDKPAASSLFNTTIQMYGKSSFDFGQLISMLSSSTTPHKADYLLMDNLDLDSLSVEDSKSNEVKAFIKYLFKSSISNKTVEEDYIRLRRHISNVINMLIGSQAGRIQVSKYKSLYPVRAINFLAVWSMFNTKNISTMKVDNQLYSEDSGQSEQISRIFVKNPSKSMFSDYLHKNQGTKGGLKGKVLIEKNMLRAKHVDVQLKTPMIYEPNKKGTTVAVVGSGWGKVSSYFNSVMRDAQLSITSFKETVSSTDYSDFVMATISSHEKIGRAALAFNNNEPFVSKLEEVEEKQSYVKQHIEKNLRGDKRHKEWSTWVKRSTNLITYMRSYLQIQLACQGIEHLLSTVSMPRGTELAKIIINLLKSYFEEYNFESLQITGTSRALKVMDEDADSQNSAVVYIDGSTKDDNEKSQTKNAKYVAYMKPVQEMMEEEPEEEETEEETTSTEQTEEEPESLDNLEEDTNLDEDIEEPEEEPEEESEEESEETNSEEPEDLDNVVENTNLDEENPSEETTSLV